MSFRVWAHDAVPSLLKGDSFYDHTINGLLQTSWHHDIPLAPIRGEIVEIRVRLAHFVQKTETEFEMVGFDNPGRLITSTQEVSISRTSSGRSSFIFSFIIRIPE